jgi:hypothetical protein
VYTGAPEHYEQTVREQVVKLGRRTRRACAGTPAHYEQTVREEDAASVCGCTGTL